MRCDKCNFKLCFFIAAWKLGSWKGGLGVAILNCMDMGNSLRVETLRMDSQWDGKIWASDNFSEHSSLRTWTSMWKKKVITHLLLLACVCWLVSRSQEHERVSFMFLIIQRVTETDEWKGYMPKWPKLAICKHYFTPGSHLFYSEGSPELL